MAAGRGAAPTTRSIAAPSPAVSGGTPSRTLRSSFTVRSSGTHISSLHTIDRMVTLSGTTDPALAVDGTSIGTGR